MYGFTNVQMCECLYPNKLANNNIRTLVNPHILYSYFALKVNFHWPQSYFLLITSLVAVISRIS